MALAISRAIVETHGGNITVTSQPGQGRSSRYGFEQPFLNRSRSISIERVTLTNLVLEITSEDDEVGDCSDPLPVAPFVKLACTSLPPAKDKCALLFELSLLLYTYVRREAVLSFQIEGTQSSLSFGAALSHY